MRGLKGKTAVVTGGAQGLGKAIAQRLSEEGCQVWILDLRQDVEETANGIRQATGYPVYFAQTDIGQENQIEQAFRRVAEVSGSVDILINNAARFIFKGIEATAQEWKEILDVNIVGTSLVTQHCVPLMKKAGGGAIVNLSSVSGFIGQSSFATYNATKFAIRGLTKCWAIDLNEFKIRVNSVCPGYIRTEAFENSCIQLGIDPEEENARISQLHILGRQGTAEEVSGVVAFVASDDASFMTGEDLMVDGGYLAK
ncbi:SDR family NAD(P)-dependent oxidoreductase [Cohnella sp. JJ-181]|uniref:SDR family NAD(P)-dependent oxidoreductase n=1 Tax=Cohnella rhizoplanae TaxID=2974897 RepID=UPI0022FF9D74|nr:SDR family oxidoreductase [Cohnella sp. JJ-181]CAI6086740.1 Cyclopentanol dehydrogenase [Cohnella sp. JJ-181]